MQLARIVGVVLAVCLLGACGGQGAKTLTGSGAAMSTADRTAAYEELLGRSKDAAGEAAYAAHQSRLLMAEGKTPGPDTSGPAWETARRNQTLAVRKSLAALGAGARDLDPTQKAMRDLTVQHLDLADEAVAAVASAMKGELSSKAPILTVWPRYRIASTTAETLVILDHAKANDPANPFTHDAQVSANTNRAYVEFLRYGVATIREETPNAVEVSARMIGYADEADRALERTDKAVQRSLGDIAASRFSVERKSRLTAATKTYEESIANERQIIAGLRTFAAAITAGELTSRDFDVAMFSMGQLVDRRFEIDRRRVALWNGAPA